MAAKYDPTFQPGPGDDIDALVHRADLAMANIKSQIGTLPDPAQQLDVVEQLYTLVEPLIGESAKVQRLGIMAAQKSTSQPSGPTEFTTARDDYRTALESATKLEQLRYDPRARSELRVILHDHFGMFSYLKVLHDQIDYLATNDTASAFDSELALVHWVAYSHVRWWENPRFYAVRKRTVPTTYMVMRLDAPKPEQVHKIITDSIAAEAAGLKGQIVIDGRGMDSKTASVDQRGLAQFDDYFRNLANLLRGSSKIQIMQDDKTEVLPPNSAKDVALYCGWYSLHNYVPECQFNPGAVGYHVASYEMLTTSPTGRLRLGAATAQQRSGRHARPRR